MAAELLARVRAEIDARLADLRPAVAEYERLLGAADALDAGDARAGARSSGEEAPKPAARAKPARQGQAGRQGQAAWPEPSRRPGPRRRPRAPRARACDGGLQGARSSRR